MDSPDDGMDDEIWSIFHHFYLDQTSLALLQEHAKKLYRLSSSMSVWLESKYGSHIRFCDTGMSGTLAQVREVWGFYHTNSARAQNWIFSLAFKSMVQKTKNHREQQGYPHASVGVRSAAPAWFPTTERPITVLLHEHFWKYGVAEADPNVIAMALYANPMFGSPDSNIVLHEGTDPLVGFHMSTAHAPLTVDSPLYTPPNPKSPLEACFAAARTEFRAWAHSFRTQGRQKLLLRFFVGDAIAFSHTMGHCRIPVGKLSAHWFRDMYHFSPLALSCEDYNVNSPAPAPMSFDIIDTSTLSHHLGALNVLTATSPLLKGGLSASLSTDLVMNGTETHQDLVANMLCGDFATVSALLGLVPVEHYTNTSSQLNPHWTQASQALVRCTWKRPPMQVSAEKLHKPVAPIRFDSIDLARVLFCIYQHMFHSKIGQHKEASDVTTNDAHTHLHTAQTPSFPAYHRASFAAFLHLVKTRVVVKWNKTMSRLLQLIEGDNTVVGGRNCIQDLQLHLHVFGVHSTVWHLGPYCTGNASFLPRGFWRHMPSVVCITLEVPRAKLRILTEKDPTFHGFRGPPLVHCVVRNSKASTVGSWRHIFSAVQMGFGRVSTTGTAVDQFMVTMDEDQLGWDGISSLFVSFRVPTSTLLLEPETGLVAFGLPSTPINDERFRHRLGVHLNVFETHLANELVHITQNLPNMWGLPSLSGFATEDVTNTPNSDAKATLEVDLNPSTGQIRRMTGRLENMSEAVKTAHDTMVRDYVSDAQQVPTVAQALSLFNYDVAFGHGPSLKLDYPVPVNAPIFRAHRDRSQGIYHIEISALCTKLCWGELQRTSLTGVMLDCTNNLQPVAWSMAYLTIDTLPRLDPRKLLEHKYWFGLHLYSMCTTRERALPDNPMLPSGPSTTRSHRILFEKDLRASPCAMLTTEMGAGERERLDFKGSLFSMFMNYGGLFTSPYNNRRQDMFTISTPITATRSGLIMVILVAGLRLDLSNRTVVLDCAVLPLLQTHVDNFAITQALEANGRNGHGLVELLVRNDERDLWLHMLPAYVERCRTWEHLPGCEYTAKRWIPLRDTVLCSCGEGIFPDNYMPDSLHKAPMWELIAKRATRAAISPWFASPLVEEMPKYEGLDLKDLFGDGEETAAAPVRCNNCGRGGTENGSELRVCNGCRKVKYCGVQCQKEDWKKHKAACKASRQA
jgi:hypothetical protein